MPVPDPFAPFLVPLEQLGVPYCITGSVAASIYGEPRLTADIDIVALLSASDVAAIERAFPASIYYVPPEETLRVEISRQARGMFNLIHHESQFKADIYVAGQDPLHEWALSNRRRIQLDAGPAWIAPPEYVVLRKLEFFREGRQDKHLRDVRFILASTQVDRAFVAQQAAARGIAAEWRLCEGGPVTG